MEEKTSFNSAEETMTNDSTPKIAWQRWKEGIAIKILAWLPGNQTERGLRSPHFWIIAVLMAVLTLVYYAGHTPLAHFGGFLSCTYPHDIHRALFLIPIIYAAVAFRGWGASITLFLLLCIVLPRAFHSPYADPLVRPLLFVLVTAFLSFLTAMLMDRVEKEEKAHAALNVAHQELSTYAQRLKDSQDELIQAEKLTSLGQMAASIAHEVNNPLSGVLVYTKLLSKKIDRDTFSKQEALGYLSKMDSEISRSARIIRNLLDFARQSKPLLRPMNINQAIEQALSLVSHQVKLQSIEVVKELSPSLPNVIADFDQLQQVFVNLTLNAVQAMPDGGRLTLRTSLVDDGQLRIDVQDTGCGISKENLRKLFTPFFTTKEKGKGVGLGLAVVHGIIQRHQGRIEVQSKEGVGTTFTIYLPVHPEEEGGKQ